MGNSFMSFISFMSWSWIPREPYALRVTA